MLEHGSGGSVPDGNLVLSHAALICVPVALEVHLRHVLEALSHAVILEVKLCLVAVRSLEADGHVPFVISHSFARYLSLIDFVSR